MYLGFFFLLEIYASTNIGPGCQPDSKGILENFFYFSSNNTVFDTQGPRTQGPREADLQSKGQVTPV